MKLAVALRRTSVTVGFNRVITKLNGGCKTGKLTNRSSYFNDYVDPYWTLSFASPALIQTVYRITLSILVGWSILIYTLMILYKNNKRRIKPIILLSLV